MARRLQSDTFTKKRRKRLYWTLVLVIIIIISWLCALSSFTHLRALAITDVKIFGADADITPALQGAAEQALTGSYLGIFHRDSTLIYPKDGIVEAIKTASPRILNVTVSRSGLHGLIITVSQKVPSAIACATLPDFDGNRLTFDNMKDCYLADATGYLFKQAPSVSPDYSVAPDYGIYYIPSLSNPVGSYATSTAEFTALQSFMATAKATGIPAQAILIKDGGEYELYASTTVIYFNDAGGLPRELSNLTVFWAHMHSAFDYVDLRYGDNVVYKMLK